jgi:hypothetical protein
MARSGASSRRRSLIWAIFGSATFHVLILVALVVAASGWLAHRERQGDPQGDDAASVAGATSGADEDVGRGLPPADDLAERDPQAMARMLHDRAAEADAMSVSERLERVQAQAAWLASRESGGVQRMADKISRFAGGVGASSRKFTPDPNATGEFEPESATLFDIVRRTESDGRVVYDWTLVDHDGRSMVTTFEAGDMSSGDLAVARVFDMARDNHNLRTLLDAAQSIVASKPDAGSAVEAMPR